MTNGLEMGDAYTATLGRIMEQDGDKGKLGIEVLMWISRSERPLHVEELCRALAIEKESTELDLQNVPAIGTLLSCCLGLVTMDQEESSVRLIHLTLQEYLSGHHHIFNSAHSKMAEVCLTYLNFQSIKDLPPTLLAPPPQTPFLSYASCHFDGFDWARGYCEATLLTQGSESQLTRYPWPYTTVDGSFEWA